MASAVRLIQEGTLNSKNNYAMRKASLSELLEIMYASRLPCTISGAVIASLSAYTYYHVIPMTYVLNTKSLLVRQRIG